ncbi:MAG: YraN family protein [Steroidobacteraceae bacterium]
MCPETTTVLGRRGEDLALQHLEARGLRLLERNYRCKGGEIDLVMLDGATLVLIEVRSRSSADYGGAAASVGAGKQRRFTLAARHLMLTRPDFRKLAARFDVVAVDRAEGSGEAVVTWVKDAFRMR